jgi:transcriptional regulator with XRE-family HTH domain
VSRQSHPKTKDSVALQLGSRIRELRIAQDLTQAQLANAADIAPSSLYQIEHGLVTPSIERLSRLATALKISMAEMFPGTTTSSVPANKRKALTALEQELLTAFLEIGDLAGKRLVIQLARRMRSR